MNTLRLRSSHIPEAWALPRFARLGTFVSTLLDIFASKCHGCRCGESAVRYRAVDAYTPSTTRMSRSTLPVPSVLSAFL